MKVAKNAYFKLADAQHTPYTPVNQTKVHLAGSYNVSSLGSDAVDVRHRSLQLHL